MFLRDLMTVSNSKVRPSIPESLSFTLLRFELTICAEQENMNPTTEITET